MMITYSKRLLATLVALCMLALPMHTQAAEIDEAPTAIEMTIDGIVVRPITLVATLVGSVIWTVTLPFSLLGGNAGDAADRLILDPAAATFVRCLGCNISGRKIDFEDDD